MPPAEADGCRFLRSSASGSIRCLGFQGLQAFLVVTKRGSVHRAAAHLGVTLTARGHRIRKFEESRGTRLLQRTTRQVPLTTTGLALLPKTRHLVEDAIDVFNELTVEAARRGRRRDSARRSAPRLPLSQS